MLKTKLIHPDLLAALGRAGHTSRVLIADGNFPILTTLGPKASLVSLNLSPGVPTVTQVLAALIDTVPFEAAAVMQYATDGPYGLSDDPPIWSEFSGLLAGAGCGFSLDRVERFAFYEEVSKPDVALAIATGEQRIYANLLLTIGVVQPEKRG